MTEEDDIDRPVEPAARFRWCSNPTCGIWIPIARDFCRRCARKPKTKKPAK